jgi:hypothetical protein
VFFGVAESTVAVLRQFVRELQEGGLTTDQQEKGLRALALHDQHALNLLYVAADILRDIQEFTYIRILPVHHFENQIAAIQTRYGLPADATKILESPLYLRFCKVCNKIYSLFRDHRSTFKNEYLWGYRNAVVDYQTLEIYCKRHKENQRGKCGEEPLSKIPLLGHLLYFNGRCMMLCPQRGCGLPMVLDFKYTFFNHLGPACSECTKKLRQPQATSITHDARCLKCWQPTQKPGRTHLYPHGVVLCKRHHLTGLARFIDDKEPVDKATTEKLIIAYLQQRKIDKLEARQPQLKRELMHRKMTARANVRR